MFPGLEPFFRENSPRLQAALQDIGKPGGMLDAQDELGDGGKQAAINLIVDPELSENNPNNPAHTAGSTFMGQFLDHDMTFDLTSRLAVVTEPHGFAQRAHARARPRLRLRRRADQATRSSTSSRAAGKPGAADEAPDRERRAVRGPAPQSRADSAIIADPRNDENMMIAGLQAAIILFHNKAVDHVRDARPSALVRGGVRDAPASSRPGTTSG